MDNDQNSAGIAMSKFQADGVRYFGLFDPHIPAGLTGNVLLLSLGNPDCVAKAVGKNPGASYTVVDDVWTLDCLRALPPSEKMDFIEDLDVYNIIKGLDMKFDCVIMNPPYRKNLHLKVLAEAIRHLKDDGVCVNLSPVRWLQDPLAKYKKHCDLKRFEESVAKHIESLDVIDGDVISKMFQGGLPTSGVYVLKLGEYNVYKTCCAISFLDKIVDKLYNMSKCEFEVNKLNGWRVKISPIYGGGTAGNHSSGKETLRNIGKLLVFKDGKKDGRPWYDFYAHNGSTKLQPEIPYSIVFPNEIEAKNFCKQYDTVFCRVFTHFVKRDVNVTPEIVLWMGDAVNPRTGLKGYLGEWTDEDFYRYFELTDDEIKTVEDTMEKYDPK